MEIIEAVRKLGEAIQSDERFVRYSKAKLANDNDKDLAEGVGKFNTIRMNLDREMNAEKPDEEKVQELNEELRKLYMDIMASEVMVEYNTARADIEAMLNDINSVIMQCIEGAEPATCEPITHDCTGSCSTCGGCH